MDSECVRKQAWDIRRHCVWKGLDDGTNLRQKQQQQRSTSQSRTLELTTFCLILTPRTAACVLLRARAYAGSWDPSGSLRFGMCALRSMSWNRF